MARADYYGIEQAIQRQLQQDPSLEGVEVNMEEDGSFQRGDVIMIYLERRDAPPGQQSISAGTRTRFNVQFSIWCFHWGTSTQPTVKARDDLLGRVEVALMRDRTFGGAVESSWITGGAFDSQKLQDGFFIGAEIRLVCDVVATTQ